MESPEASLVQREVGRRSRTGGIVQHVANMAEMSASQPRLCDKSPQSASQTAPLKSLRGAIKPCFVLVRR